jgi:Uma2 family endonuclease
MTAVREQPRTYRVEERPDEVLPWRCSIDDFLAMDAAGIFHEDSRVELIDGELFQLAAKHVPHERWRHDLLRLFVLTAPEDVSVLTEPSLRLDDNVYEPDLVVLPKALWRAQRDGLPTFAARDLLLIIEVSDSSRHHDRVRKAAAYARHGVPEYWILDAVGPGLTVHQGPLASGSWREVLTFGPDVEITPAALPGVIVRLDRLG